MLFEVPNQLHKDDHEPKKLAGSYPKNRILLDW